MRRYPYVMMAAVVALLCVPEVQATLEGQLTKTQTLMSGTVMKLVAGGGTLFGGILAIVKGNLMLGLSVLGCLVLTSLGMALINTDMTAIFNP